MKRSTNAVSERISNMPGSPAAGSTVKWLKPILLPLKTRPDQYSRSGQCASWCCAGLAGTDSTGWKYRLLHPASQQASRNATPRRAAATVMSRTDGVHEGRLVMQSVNMFGMETSKAQLWRHGVV